MEFLLRGGESVNQVNQFRRFSRKRSNALLCGKCLMVATDFIGQWAFGRWRGVCVAHSGQDDMMSVGTNGWLTWDSRASSTLEPRIFTLIQGDSLHR